MSIADDHELSKSTGHFLQCQSSRVEHTSAIFLRRQTPGIDGLPTHAIPGRTRAKSDNHHLLELKLLDKVLKRLMDNANIATHRGADIKQHDELGNRDSRSGRNQVGPTEVLIEILISKFTTVETHCFSIDNLYAKKSIFYITR